MQKLLLYIAIVLLCVQCAQITPLTGGKKDTTAPKALKYEPENTSLNFTSKTIEVQFDEYIVLKDVANQFIITPQTKEMPEIQASGKKLKITFNETLLPNTTYKLVFGNSITDLNESNALQNFEYIFSTGSVIDSLKISGTVANAFDKKPSAQVLIGLYNLDAADSIIYKEKPLYITKTSDGGNFSINHLPESKFKLAAIKDQNKNLMYDGSEEQIGFTKENVSGKDSSSLNILLFKEIPVKNFIKKSSLTEPGKIQIIFNKPQPDVTQVRAAGMIHSAFTKTLDTLNLYYTNKFDTLTALIKYTNRKTDTVLVKLPSANSGKKPKQELKYVIESNLGSALPFFELPQLQLNFPVDSKTIKSEKFILTEKEDTVSRILPFTIVKDTGLIRTLKINAAFKPESSYTLTVLKNAFYRDSTRTSDSLSFKFKTTMPEDYAQLNLKLLFPKKENYVVQLLNEKETIVNEQKIEFALSATSEKMLSYKNLLPGNYFIKVIEDVNKNGLFDTGDYFLKTQPEIIFYNLQPIKLLAGWEIENEWTVQ